MSFEAERVRIETHFQTSWAAGAFASTTVLFENTNRVQPTGGNYIMHRITDSAGQQAEVAGSGAVFHRYVGMVQIDIMVTVGNGTSPAKKMADVISNIYRRQQLLDTAGGLMTFRTPSIRSMGSTSEHYRFVVTCPYHRDIRQ